MATFRFRLEPVLRHRRTVEETHQRELAKVLRHRMIVENELRRMQTTITDSKQELADGLVGRVDMDRVGEFARYSGQVRQRAHTIVVKLATLEKVIDRERGKLSAATRERKAIELLRDRHHEQWKLEEARREALEMDELATQQYARQAMGVI
jgi:flagellar FliJ protein